MQAALKKGHFFRHLVTLNGMFHLSSRAHRPLCSSTSQHVISFLFLLHIFFVNSHCISVFRVFTPLPPIWVLSEWKPKRWFKRKKKKNRGGELLSPCGALRRQLHAAAGRRTRTNSAMWRKPRNGCNKSANPQGCLRHRTFQLDTRWCGFSFAITPVCNSDQMSVNSKGKQSRHRLFFIFLNSILINVIPVCPHVYSIHLHVCYLIFTLFIEAIT